MTDGKIIPLTELDPMRRGRIHSLDGWPNFVRRLESMGLRQGRRITKISGQAMRGPVTVSVGGTSMALGHGMASRVMVEVEG